MYNLSIKVRNIRIKEDIIGFATPDIGLPFFIQMAGISYCDGSYLICRPQSEIICFEYIIQGCGTVQTEGKIFHPIKGDIYMLHAGHDHYYYSDADDPWIKI